MQKLMKFPESKELANNVLVGILSQSTFAVAMNEFLSGLSKSLGVDSEKGLQLYQVVGGTLQSMAFGNKPESIKTKKNGKR
jgi:hypothetical protein